MERYGRQILCAGGGILCLIPALCGCTREPVREPVPARASDAVASADTLTNEIAAALCTTERSLSLHLAPEFDRSLLSVCADAARQRSVIAGIGLSALDWQCKNNVFSCSFTYVAAQDTLRRQKAELTLEAVQFRAETAQFSQQVRVLLAHDRLLRTCRYMKNAPYGDSAVGALLLHAAECGGYAEAFALLMEAADCPCKVMTGYAGGVAHAWNLVQLAGVWYHLDCAWDDAEENEPSHAYFLCDDAAMAQTHTWDAALYPAAAGGVYSYRSVAAEMLPQWTHPEKTEESAYETTNTPAPADRCAPADAANLYVYGAACRSCPRFSAGFSEGCRSHGCPDRTAYLCAECAGKAPDGKHDQDHDRPPDA